MDETKLIVILVILVICIFISYAMNLWNQRQINKMYDLFEEQLLKINKEFTDELVRILDITSNADAKVMEMQAELMKTHLISAHNISKEKENEV